MRNVIVGFALMCLLALLSTCPAMAGGAVVQPASKRRFDHDAHTASLAKMGKPAALCNSCHPSSAAGEPTLTGKREHARCFEGCHTFSSSCSTMAAGLGQVCAACHPTLKSACLPSLPPKPGLSFEAKFSHGRHTQAGASAEPLCLRCHAVQAFAAGAAEPTTSAHRDCSGCHERGAAPLMNKCDGCHRSPQPTLAAAPNPYRLESFDHRSHMKHAKQSACLGCHQDLQKTGNENSLPKPQMASCQAQCHNGKVAFTATGTSCTKCHQNQPGVTDAAALQPPSVAGLSFSHAVHKNRGVDMAACGSCHQLESNGQVLAAGMGKDHAPCANSGCHEREFYARTTKICTSCHANAVSAVGAGKNAQFAATTPWQKPTLRAIEVATSELPGPMNHAVHLTGAASGNAACAGCHGDVLAGGAVPKGHAACMACHNKPANARVPAMTACQSCHALGGSAPHRAASSWSVAATFEHKSHGKDPQRAGATPACTQCHCSIAASVNLANTAAPTMQSCDRCHNGRDAFKTTGFECARCHSRGAKPDLMPRPSSALVKTVKERG
jgi:c(7)-type cytochrome triheme protein